MGDSVLGLAVTTRLLEDERLGAGRLTKVRAQAVSRRSCAVVADGLGIPERLAQAAPPASTALARTESVLAEVLEAVIGACFLHFGFERTAEAVIEAFEPRVAESMSYEGDFKSALQERLAQRGDVVTYPVLAERGPPHDRTFEVAAEVRGTWVGQGTGASKKEAEQSAARAALDALGEGADR